MTSIVPGSISAVSLSARLIGNPFCVDRYTHYLAVDVTGLDLTEGRGGVFVIPGREGLELKGRVVSHGRWATGHSD